MRSECFSCFIENLAIKRISIAPLLPLVIFLIGILNYHNIEGLVFFEGPEVVFKAISLVGFFEINLITAAEQTLTMCLFVSSIGIISYLASQTTQLVVESEFILIKAMKKIVSQLDDHPIICGYDRFERRIAHVLQQAGLPVVIIENRSPTKGAEL